MPTSDSTYSWSSDRIPPSPMSVSYRASLLVVAVAMVLLPVIYVGFCLGVAWGIYYYALNAIFLLGYHQVGIVLYLGVIVAGCIGLVFMIKPLFTSQNKVDVNLPITREAEPELFRFIEEVCRCVGAPRPVKVLVNSQVNASASFDKGLWGMATNRLVLTIGLPLAQGLTVTQLGGVLAHEFGHFTQAIGMRLNFVIWSINRWFNRVIYERDAFDYQLKTWTKRGNIYWLAMANIAVGFVWIARKILWVLMMTGHAVSAYMMRQMEYDADYYERQITGHQNFRDTFLQMQLIGAGSQMAIEHLKRGQFVDDLPRLTHYFTSTIPLEEVEARTMAFHADQSSAKWYATHPSDYQRILRAPGDHAGILLGDKSGDTLFSNFSGLAEQVTQIDYSKRYKLKLKPGSIIKSEDYVQRNSSRMQKIRDMHGIFGNLLSDQRLIFPYQSAAESNDVSAMENRLAEITAYLEEQSEVTKQTSIKINTLRNRRASVMAAQTLIEIGVAIKAAAFNLPNLAPATIEDVLTHCSEEISRHEEELRTLTYLAGEKLHLLCLLVSNRFQGSDDNSGLVERINTLEGFLISAQPLSTLLNEKRKAFFTASICVNNYQAAKNKKNAEALFESLAKKFSQATGEVEVLANKIAYPLQDGTSHAHLTAYFLKDNNQPGSMGQYRYLGSIYDRFAFLYTEVMLELLDAVSGNCTSKSGQVLSVR